MEEPPYILKIHKIKKSNKNNVMNNILKNNMITITKNFKNKTSPLSGSELKYEPHKWNNEKIINNHNCYSYAMGKIVHKLKDKAQPGYASGFNYLTNTNMNCKNMKKRLLKDNPASYIEKFSNRCMPGFYKVFLALDIGNDYHWWRQDKSSYWSHKPGSTKISNKDGNNKLIINPLKSSRNFKHRNYNKACFYACIQSDLSRTLDDIYKK